MADKLPTRQENYSEWYNQLIQKADLAENSAVRGCMVIKPYGFAIRENMQSILDQMFKNTGHQNAYFPIFIPKSFFSKEASHVSGFAKECAVVTHHRLKNSEDGKSIIVDPDAKLEEELIVRPTSETIIRHTYKNWITSYRSLPLLINQRANVVRWEMRTRAFIRTAEFLWQEGHTAHSTKEEAQQESKKMLDVYYDFMTNYLAIDPILGEKTENERFAGADNTYTLEAIMQDGKALQSGTSHFLGQNFAKAFDVKFTNEHNEQEFVRATSRGVSTRMMGALIMSHSDDNGLVLPPAIAPLHVVIIPIFKTQEDLIEIKKYLDPLFRRLDETLLEFMSNFGNILSHNPKLDKGFARKLYRKLDDDTNKSPGWKFNERELKGVPLVIVVGARDINNGTIEVRRRISQDKETIKLDDAIVHIPRLLYKMQNTILENNQKFVEKNTYIVDSRQDFQDKIEIGFVMAHRDGTIQTEQKIQELTKATIRCIPFDQIQENGKCILTGRSSNQRVLFAKAY